MFKWGDRKLLFHSSDFSQRPVDAFHMALFRQPRPIVGQVKRSERLADRRIGWPRRTGI